MVQGVGIVINTLILLGMVALICHARHGMDHGIWAKEKSIMCYECNSEYDPRCGDPFDNYTIGVVNCSKKRPLDHIIEKPTLCRKTVQKVQGHLRIIRGCGYIPDPKYDNKECMRRTGTHDVEVRYCSCKGSLCNTADFQARKSPAILLTAIFLAITRWN